MSSLDVLVPFGLPRSSVCVLVGETIVFILLPSPSGFNDQGNRNGTKMEKK